MSEPIFGLLPPAGPPDPGLVHATDHGDRGVAALLAQLRDKARFTTLVRIYMKLFQELEDVFWDLYTKRRLDTATGVQLDSIGKIVTEARAGLDDTSYRAILRIKIRALLSRGTGNDLITIAKLMLGTTPFTYDELWPATVVITLLDEPAFPAALLARFLRRAKAAGVRLDLVGGFESGATFQYGDNTPTIDMLHSYDFGQYAGDL